MNSYANSQTRLTNVSRINASRLDASRLDPTKVGAVDLNNDVVEPKKADNSKQTMQLLVILVCALTVVLFVFKSQNDKGGSNGLSTATKIAWQVQKEGDEQLAEDVRAAYVNEWSQPVVAKASYKAIEYNVKLRLEDPNDKLSQETLEKVLNIVEARLAALDSVL